MGKMMYRNIDCKYPIEIERNEIYPAIYEYILPEDYFFECQGNNYGNRIYAREITDNFYIVRKKSDGGYKQTDSDNQEV